jgi:single-strand DNA-binding protein
MNCCCFIGNITREPELKFIQGTGKAVCKFTIAVGKSYKKDGEPDSDFINCVSFGKQAELIAERFTKGSKIGVTGRYTNNDYMKDGKKVYNSVIILNNDGLTFVERKSNTEYNNKSNDTNFDGMTQVDSDSDITF